VTAHGWKALWFHVRPMTAQPGTWSSLTAPAVLQVEHYFNYMGMLAVEGTYDRMEAMLASGLEPVDVLLLMAASENDAPKVRI